MDKCEVTLLTSYKWHQGFADVIWSGQGQSQGVTLTHQDNVKTSYYCCNPLGYHTSNYKNQIMRDNVECFDEGWLKKIGLFVNTHKHIF